jgi:hypothetical protein
MNVRPQLRRGLARAGLVAVFAAVTIAWTWPLVLDFPRAFLVGIREDSTLAVADRGLVAWLLAWGAHALRTNPLGLFHANDFHPAQRPRLQEHLLGGTSLLPLDLLA